jgi:hypothetical protein
VFSETSKRAKTSCISFKRVSASTVDSGGWKGMLKHYCIPACSPTSPGFNNRSRQGGGGNPLKEEAQRVWGDAGQGGKGLQILDGGLDFSCSKVFQFFRFTRRGVDQMVGEGIQIMSGHQWVYGIGHPGFPFNRMSLSAIHAHLTWNRWGMSKGRGVEEEKLTARYLDPHASQPMCYGCRSSFGSVSWCGSSTTGTS